MPQSAQKSLITQLPSECIATPDAKTKFFIGWWQRMHEEPDPLRAVALKFVEWADDRAKAQRFVWEVCWWSQGPASEWTFVCWMIDGDGMWMKSFPSKRAAMAYFRLPPDVVMATPGKTDEERLSRIGVRHRVAS